MSVVVFLCPPHTHTHTHLPLYPFSHSCRFSCISISVSWSPALTGCLSTPPLETKDLSWTFGNLNGCKLRVCEHKTDLMWMKREGYALQSADYIRASPPTAVNNRLPAVMSSPVFRHLLCSEFNRCNLLTCSSTRVFVPLCWWLWHLENWSRSSLFSKSKKILI